MPDKHLGVTPVQQETKWFCGPASAEMVLTFLGVAPPAGPATWQEQLRTYIEKNTNSKRPSLKKAPDDPDNNPAYNEQKCEWNGEEYECWATTPNVLKKLMNANQAVTAYAVSHPTTERGATDAMLDSVDIGRPAIALIDGWLHFVVIEGYQHDEAGHETTFNRNLNGVYFCDPIDGKLHYKAIDQWFGESLYWVPYGTYADEFVVIRAKT
jgi:hypothetical protein